MGGNVTVVKMGSFKCKVSFFERWGFQFPVLIDFRATFYHSPEQ